MCLVMNTAIGRCHDLTRNQQPVPPDPVPTMCTCMSTRGSSVFGSKVTIRLHSCFQAESQSRYAGGADRSFNWPCVGKKNANFQFAVTPSRTSLGMGGKTRPSKECVWQRNGRKTIP